MVPYAGRVMMHSFDSIVRLMGQQTSRLVMTNSAFAEDSTYVGVRT